MPRLAKPCAPCAAALCLLLCGAARADVIAEVRALASAGQRDQARQRLAQERVARGLSPDLAEAMSWLARADLAGHRYSEAMQDATETYTTCQQLLASRSIAGGPPADLDAERHLPIALGAALEVQAQVLAARGQRPQAVALLHRELAAHGKTSIALRLQKNLNLLTLRGQTAPALDGATHLGPKPPSLASLKGRPVLLFFWAHWCGDCKVQAPVIAALKAELGPRGLQVLAPTQPYGFAAGGQEASPEGELRHIERVWQTQYAALGGVPVPVSAANFRSYGASSMPTLVLIDKAGQVALYHPGRMPQEELRQHLEAALAQQR